jgi:chemotaxis protein methyltransferase CheR
MIKDRAAAADQKSDREYDFSDDDFRALRDLVKQMTGISLAETKRELVYGRVSRRLRALGLKTSRNTAACCNRRTHPSSSNSAMR